MDTFAFIFAMLGFIFGINAMSQVSELRKEIEQLKQT